MRGFKHDNLVEFIGIACQKEPLMIIVEFCGGGSLLKVPGNVKKSFRKCLIFRFKIVTNDKLCRKINTEVIFSLFDFITDYLN